MIGHNLELPIIVFLKPVGGRAMLPEWSFFESERAVSERRVARPRGLSIQPTRHLYQRRGGNTTPETKFCTSVGCLFGVNCFSGRPPQARARSQAPRAPV